MRATSVSASVTVLYRTRVEAANVPAMRGEARSVLRRLRLRVRDGLGVGELDGDADGIACDVGCAEVVGELP